MSSPVLLDSHIHFWDTDRLDYPWLHDFPRLDRPRRLEHLSVDGVRVEAFVVVQANPRWSQADAETAWLLGLGALDPRAQAVVTGVRLELGATAVEPGLHRLSCVPAVVGVRQLIQDEPDGFAVRSDFVDAVRLAGAYGFVVDLCVRRHQLPEVTRLVEQCPSVEFVLDHLGKPDVAGGERTVWAEQIGALARLPNVHCKLSGLTSEADDRTIDVTTIGGYLRAAIDAFGPRRCMFGSDWPNASVRISYAGWVEMVTAAISDLEPDEQDRVMRGTARSVYSRAWRPADLEGGPGDAVRVLRDS